MPLHLYNGGVWVLTAAAEGKPDSYHRRQLRNLTDARMHAHARAHTHTRGSTRTHVRTRTDAQTHTPTSCTDTYTICYNYYKYTITHVRWGMTGYSGLRAWLEAKGQESCSRAWIPGRCPGVHVWSYFVFQTYHTAETRTYAETCAYTRSSRIKIGMLVSKPPWHPLVVCEHVVGKASICMLYFYRWRNCMKNPWVRGVAG